MASTNSNLTRDDLLVQYLQVHQRVLDLKNQLSASLKEGLFSIAKARQVGGLSSMSKKQYDKTMKATLGVEFLGDKFKMHKIKTEEDKTDDSDTTDASDTEAEETESTASTTEESKKTDKPKRKPTSGDPLMWFGMHTKNALKPAQAKFMSAIGTSVDIANLQHELLRLEQQIKAAH